MAAASTSRLRLVSPGAVVASATVSLGRGRAWQGDGVSGTSIIMGSGNGLVCLLRNSAEARETSNGEAGVSGEDGEELSCTEEMLEVLFHVTGGEKINAIMTRGGAEGGGGLLIAVAVAERVEFYDYYFIRKGIGTTMTKSLDGGKAGHWERTAITDVGEKITACSFMTSDGRKGGQRASANGIAFVGTASGHLLSLREGNMGGTATPWSVENRLPLFSGENALIEEIKAVAGSRSVAARSAAGRIAVLCVPTGGSFSSEDLIPINVYDLRLRGPLLSIEICMDVSTPLILSTSQGGYCQVWRPPCILDWNSGFDARTLPAEDDDATALLSQSLCQRGSQERVTSLSAMAHLECGAGVRAAWLPRNRYRRATTINAMNMATYGMKPRWAVLVGREGLTQIAVIRGWKGPSACSVQVVLSVKADEPQVWPISHQPSHLLILDSSWSLSGSSPGRIHIIGSCLYEEGTIFSTTSMEISESQIEAALLLSSHSAPDGRNGTESSHPPSSCTSSTSSSTSLIERNNGTCDDADTKCVTSVLANSDYISCLGHSGRIVHLGHGPDDSLLSMGDNGHVFQWTWRSKQLSWVGKRTFRELDCSLLSSTIFCDDLENTNICAVAGISDGSVVLGVFNSFSKLLMRPVVLPNEIPIESIRSMYILDCQNGVNTIAFMCSAQNGLPAVVVVNAVLPSASAAASFEIHQLERIESTACLGAPCKRYEDSSVCFSSAGQDGMVTLWNIVDGTVQSIGTFKAYKKAFDAIAVSERWVRIATVIHEHRKFVARLWGAEGSLEPMNIFLDGELQFDASLIFDGRAIPGSVCKYSCSWMENRASLPKLVIGSNCGLVIVASSPMPTSRREWQVVQSFKYPDSHPYIPCFMGVSCNTVFYSDGCEVRTIETDTPGPVASNDHWRKNIQRAWRGDIPNLISALGTSSQEEADDGHSAEMRGADRLVVPFDDWPSHLEETLWSGGHKKESLSNKLANFVTDCVTWPEKSLDAAARRSLCGLLLRHHMGSSVTELPSPEEILAFLSLSESKDALLSTFFSSPMASDTWEYYRSCGIGYWMETGALRDKMEKLARLKFTAHKDPYDCALLYISLGRTKVLQGLFRVQRNDRMVNFLNRDFGVQEHRAAAMKNAYVLMGQRRFELAAAFFVLGGSPLDAVGICCRNMNDPQLGAVVVRLSCAENFDKLVDETLLAHAHNDRNAWQEAMYHAIRGRRVEAVTSLISQTLRMRESGHETPGGDSIFDFCTICLKASSEQLVNPSHQKVMSEALCLAQVSYEMLHMPEVALLAIREAEQLGKSTMSDTGMKRRLQNQIARAPRKHIQRGARSVARSIFQGEEASTSPHPAEYVADDPCDDDLPSDSDNCLRSSSIISLPGELLHAVCASEVGEHVAVATNKHGLMDLAMLGQSGISSDSVIDVDIRELIPPFNPIRSMDVVTRTMTSHPYDAFYVSGSSDGNVYLWRFGFTSTLDHGESLDVFPVVDGGVVAGDSNFISQVCWSVDATRLAAISRSGTSCLWSPGCSSWPLPVLGGEGLFSSFGRGICFRGSSSSVVVAVGETKGNCNLQIVDALLPPHISRVASCVTHADGGATCASVLGDFLVLSGGKSGDVNLHDLRKVDEKGAPVWSRQKLHTGDVIKTLPVGSIMMNDLPSVVTGGRDGNIKILSIVDGSDIANQINAHERKTFLMPRGPGKVINASLTDLAEIEGGFLSCGGDGVVKRWKMQL